MDPKFSFFPALENSETFRLVSFTDVGDHVLLKGYTKVLERNGVDSISFRVPKEKTVFRLGYTNGHYVLIELSNLTLPQINAYIANTDFVEILQVPQTSARAN